MSERSRLYKPCGAYMVVPPGYTSVQVNRPYDLRSWSRVGLTTTTSSMLLEDATNGSHYVLQSFSLPATPVAKSTKIRCVARAGTRSWLAISPQGWGYRYFGLSGSGTVGVGANATGRIIALGGGWFFCELTPTAGSTTNSDINFHMCAGDNQAGYQGNGGGTLFLTAVQVLQAM